MKTSLTIALLVFSQFVQSNLLAEDNLDKYIALDGSPELQRFGDSWFKITIPFFVKSHPEVDELQGRKPTVEEFFNPEFIDKLKIKLTVCFTNELKRKYGKGDRSDILFNDYYSSEFEVLILKVDRSTKEASFLLPSIIAERDQYSGSTPKLVGYAVEFSRNGKSLNVSDSVSFQKYKTEEILDKFKEECDKKAPQNEGLLIPAHLIDPSFLRTLGPVHWNQ